MRFHFVLGLAAISPLFVDSAAVCSTTTSFVGDSSSWYNALGECISGQSKPAHFTQASLLVCVNGLTSPPTQLLAHLNATSRNALFPCSTCTLSFVNSLVDLFESEFLRSKCMGGSIGAWTWDVTKFSSGQCTPVLRVAIDEFNTCSNNGYDISTAALSNRCTALEFRDLLMNHDLYESLAMAAMTTGGSIATNAEVYLSAGLKSAVAGLSNSCQSVLSTFVDGLRAFTDDSSGKCYVAGTPTPLVASCVTDATIASLINAFESGSGSNILTTAASTHCPEQAALINGIIRPYQSLTKCSTFATLAEQQSCVSKTNGFFDLVDSNLNCFPCFAKFMENAKTSGAIADGCLADPTSSLCVLIMNSWVQPLYEFAMCAGFELDASVTRCNSTPIASYAQIAGCALSTDPNLCIANVHPVNDLLGPSKSGCFGCYWALLKDIEAMNVRTDYLLASVCRNPFKAECKEALSGEGKPLGRFYSCSGLKNLVASSGITCSSDQFGLVNKTIGLPAKALEFAFAAKSVTEAMYNYEIFLDKEMEKNNLQYSDIPCVSCFYDLIDSGFALSGANKQVCAANIASSECQLGTALETFYACSGHEITLESEILAISSTTVPPMSTIAAGTTTTTKNVAMATVYGLLLLMSFN